MTPPCKPGDWISYMSNSQLCISEVRYIKKKDPGYWGDYWEIVTDSALIGESRILEVRSRQSAEGTP